MGARTQDEGTYSSLGLRQPSQDRVLALGASSFSPSRRRKERCAMSMIASRPVDAGRAIARGVVGGLTGAIVMMIVEVAGALLAGRSPFIPAQMLAALVLGPKIAGLERVGMAQMAPATTTTILVGLGVHLALSIA